MVGFVRWTIRGASGRIFGRGPLGNAPDCRRRRTAPALEWLETRQLLTAYTGPSANRPVSTPSGGFWISVSGPGVVEVHHTPTGAINLNVYGTTSGSTLTITQTAPRYHATSRPLAIQTLTIRSRQLGGLSATAVALEGKMTPVANTMNTLELGTIGPKAQVDVNGSVGTMTVSSIDLGPTGHVAITGDVNTIAQSGPMTIGAVTIEGGRFSIGRDSLASIAINGDVSISKDGKLSIGRDQDGTFTVYGSMVLSTGGQLVIGRDLSALGITGNLIVQPSGSGVAIDGALQSLTVAGYVEGQGGQSAPAAVDLGVGLNLSNLSILGGISGQGGLINANIRAGGTVSGVDIPYGTSNSNIQSNAAMPT